jgi:hypothetical protein
VCEILMERPLEELAPEFVVSDYQKDWTRPAWDWGYSIEGLQPGRRQSEHVTA